MSIAIKRNFTIPSTSSIGASEISLSSSTASTSVDTGAIVSSGGAGISGAISLGGPLKLYNGSYYTAFDSSATASTTYVWPAVSPSTGTSVLSSDAAGNLSWILMSASGSGLTLNGLDASIQYFSTSISGSGFTISSIGSTHTFHIGLAGSASTGLISSSSQTLFGLKTFASGAAITSSTASSSTTSGALTVTGGVGIGASVNIGGKVGINTGAYTGTFNITTPSASTPGLVVQGSTSQTADYLQILSSAGTTSFSINSSGRLSWPSSSVAQIYNTSYSSQGRIVVSGNLYVNPGPFIVDTGAGEASMTSTSVTFGGVGWGVYGSPARVSTDNAVRIQPTSTSVVPLVVQLQNASWTSGNAFEIQNNGVLKFNVDYTGSTTILSTTGSGSTSTGALVVSGGVGIGGSLNVYKTTTVNDNVIINSAKEIRFYNSSNTFYTGIKAGVTTSSTTFTLPIADGTANQVLYTNGSAALGWTSISASSTGITSLNGLITTTQSFATSISGSGFTIGSSTSTHTFYIGLAGSASTGLISSAAQTLFGLKSFASGVAVTSGTASTNTTTGALIVAGGVGITGQLSVNTIALGSTGVSITPSMTYVGTAGTVISMSVLSDTTLAWEGSSGQLFSIDNNLSSGEIFSVSDISGLPVITASAGQTITLNEFGGYTQVGNGLASTNTTTGALRVIGGVGITGSLYLGSPLLVPSGGTGLTSYTTGDILHASSSTTIGRISAGTAGSILTSAGTGATPYWAAATGSTLAIAGTNNGDIQYKSASALGASSAFNFDASTSTFKLTGFPIEAVSSTSANVKILGGSVSWSGSINGTMLAVNTANTYTGDLLNAQIGGTSRFKVSYTGAVSIGNSYTLPIADGAANQVLQTNGSGTVSWASSVISSAQYNIGYYESAGAAVTGSSTFTNNTSTRVVSIGHTTASTGFSSGALVVTGGVGIGKTLYVGGDIYQNTNAITAYDTGFRNRIINGDFYIDQRNGAGTTITATNQNVTDRWKMYVSGTGRITSGQNYGAVASPSPFTSYYGMKVTTTTTPGVNDYNLFSQIIEGPNTIDLQWGTSDAQSVTLSFWAYSSLTGTFGGCIRNFGTFNRSYPFTYTISSANTWEKKTVIIPGDTTGTWTTSTNFGIELIFIIANGSTFQASPGAWAAGNFTGPSGSLVNLIGTLNSILYLTGVQIEIGTVATLFEKRNYGHELFLCQRYYQISSVRVGGYHTTGNYLRGSAYLNTAMRPIASPILTVLSTDESTNLGSLNADTSNFRGDSFRYLAQVTTTGDAFGQWKVSCDCEL